MLLSERLEFLMEAHNGLSARIVREAGFGGIWASGLSMAAQFGVRDNNEASWTQIVDLLEFMVDASDLPILLDGDTGYGNFNNMRRLVRKLEQRGVAGVCIEDKQFPKTNSFLNGERQPLADVAEFAGKIMAGKDTQRDGDFCIVARVEALIAGWGMPEALRRAEAYRLAGADAILIHSKLAKADEIVTFAREWAGRAPLVIVPTRYYSTPTEVFREAGISMVIWANHMLRAAIAAMQSVAREVQLSQTLVNVEDRIVSVQEVFRLQDAEEYSEAERLYLAQADAARAAVVLAAGRGRGLEAVTTDRPKLMLPIGGRPLLGWLIESFKKEGVNDITVVGGYRAAAIDPSGIKLTLNERYAETGELASLACALNDMQSDTVVCYGDLLFRSYVLRDLLECEADFAVVVDSSAPGAINSTVRDFAFCSRSDDRDFFGSGALLQRVASLGDDAAGTPARTSGPPTPQGRWIGMLHVRRQALARLKSVMAVLRARPDFDSLDVPALLNALVADGATVQVVYVHGHWRSVNDLEELRHAVDFAHGQNLLGAATTRMAARGNDRGAGLCRGRPGTRILLVRRGTVLVPDPVHQLRPAGQLVALPVHGQRGGCGRVDCGSDPGRHRPAAAAWHFHDAKFGAGQCGESAHVPHLDLPPAAAVDRNLARAAGRRRRAAARAHGAHHAAAAGADADPVGVISRAARGDCAGARACHPAYGLERATLCAAHAKGHGRPLRSADGSAERRPAAESRAAG